MYYSFSELIFICEIKKIKPLAGHNMICVSLFGKSAALQASATIGQR